MHTSSFSPMTIIDPSDLLSEEEVIARWRMLTRAELRRARKDGTIEFYEFRKRSGGPCYTPQQVQGYLDRTYLRPKIWLKRPDSGAPTATVNVDLTSADITS